MKITQNTIIIIISINEFYYWFFFKIFFIWINAKYVYGFGYFFRNRIEHNNSGSSRIIQKINKNSLTFKNSIEKIK